MPPALTTGWEPTRPLDLAGTLAPLRHGRGDPCWRREPDGAFWHARGTDDGPATVRVRHEGGRVEVAAWGPGARRALDDVPHLLGEHDDPTGFVAGLHPVVREAHRRRVGVRLGASRDLWGSLVPAVLEQRVVGLDAQAAWRRLVVRHGERAPGPAPDGLVVAPPAAVWARLPVWEWRGAGVDDQRARTVVRAAAVAPRLAGDEAEARARLESVPGIGPWTVAEVTSRVFGDPDAVSVGDAHLPHLVGWCLTGRRTDDEGMLALLEPWRGHRQRVVRLLEAAHRRDQPVYGPRAPRALPMR